MSYRSVRQRGKIKGWKLGSKKDENRNGATEFHNRYDGERCWILIHMTSGDTWTYNGSELKEGLNMIG